MSTFRSAIAVRRSIAAFRAAAPSTGALRAAPGLFVPTQRCLWFPNPGASKPKQAPTPEPEKTVQSEKVPEAHQPETHAQELPPKPTPQPTPEPADCEALAVAQKQLADLTLELEVARKHLGDAEEKIATLHESIQDWEQVALRERADAENARRIAREDVKSERVYAIKNFAKDLLEIPDTFASAILHARKSGLADDERGAKFFSGIEAVERVLTRAMERHGVKRQVVVPGETIFNPDQHEALTLVPSEGTETYHHTVLDVFQPGYTLGDRVLRAAKVVVADNPSKPAPTPAKAE